MMRSQDAAIDEKKQTEAKEREFKRKNEICLNDDKEHAPCAANYSAKPSVHYPEEIDDQHQTMHKLDCAEAAPPSVPFADDNDDEEEDYNWLTEDDLLHEEAKKYDERLGLKSKRPRNFCFRVIEFFISTLVGTLMTAGLIALPGIFIHVFYRKRKPDESRSYVSDNVEAWCYWAATQFVISWVLAFILDIVPGIVTWTIFIVWGHISESMKSRVELYNTVKGTIKPLFYAGSGWVSWVILFSGIFNLYDMNNESKSRASYTPKLYRVVQFFFFLTLVLCIQGILSLINASIFHRTVFKDRLEATKSALRAINHLKQYKPRQRDRSSRHFNVFTAPKLSFAAGWGSNSRPGTPSPIADDKNVGENEGSAAGGSDNDERRLSIAVLRKGKKPRKKHYRTETRSGQVSEADVADALLPARDLGASRSSSPGPEDTPNESGNVSAATSQYEHSPYTTYPPRGTATRTSTMSNSPGEALPTLPFAGPGRGQAQQRNVPPPIKHAAADERKVTKNFVKTIKAAVFHDARNITGHEHKDLSGLGWNVGSAREAKRQARSIYEAFKAPRRKYLISEDFYPAYPTHEEAEKAFRVFDIDNNGDINRAEIKTAIVKTYRERRALTRSMRDINEALHLLDQILLLGALLILFFISLSIFNVDISKSLSSIYTIFIAASFIFKSSSSRAFDAIMFLFVTHPFDTGDRCFIKNENLVVKKMGLFATVFTRADGTETYYFNSQLFTQLITNARRSAKTTEQLALQVAWRTPLEKLDALEKCLNEWLSTEEHRWFEPTTSITLQKIIFQRHLEFTIGIPHNGNWQDWGLTLSRKTAFCAAVNYYCRQLGIKATNSTMPVVLAHEDDDNAADWNNASSLMVSPSSAASSTSDKISGSHLDHGASAETPVIKTPESGIAQQEGHEAQDTEEQDDLKPVLGFLPPPNKRSKTLLRARKTKKSKAFAKFEG